MHIHHIQVHERRTLYARLRPHTITYTHTVWVPIHLLLSGILYTHAERERPHTHKYIYTRIHTHVSVPIHLLSSSKGSFLKHSSIPNPSSIHEIAILMNMNILFKKSLGTRTEPVLKRS